MAVPPVPYETTDRKVEPTTCSIVHTEFLPSAIHEALLVSAYDIRHSLLTDSESFKQGFRTSKYSIPKLLFIDSGWYEKSSGGALFGDAQAQRQPWDEKTYRETIDSLDGDIPAVVVGFDHSDTYPEQIANAQEFFGHRPGFASTILLKAPEKSRFHEFEGLSQIDASNLNAFDIIGVTEKELGGSILDRLVTLAGFRSQLYAAGVTAPIHVFGGLDPLYTPLLFAAGAEIFDGLGWLRYAYRDGVAMHREAGAILDNPPDITLSILTTMVQIQNLKEIGDLAGELNVFVNTKGDWTVFRTGDRLKRVHEIFEAKLEMNGGRH